MKTRGPENQNENGVSDKALNPTIITSEVVKKKETLKLEFHSGSYFITK